MVCLAHVLFLISTGPQLIEWHFSELGWIFSPQLTYLDNSFRDMARACPLGDSRFLNLTININYQRDVAHWKQYDGGKKS